MKNNWFWTSIISGLLGGLIIYLLVRNWQLAIIAAVFILIVVMVNNPKRRYMKYAWAVFSALLALNKFSFEFIAKIAGAEIKIESYSASDALSIGLIILIIVCFIFDFLERKKENSKTPFISFKSNKVGDINGDNNSINQTNV